MAETVLVSEEPIPEAFADLYAASSQAFANSRAIKSQKETELEDLERSLPTAESAALEAVKTGNMAVADAESRAAAMRQSADAEVTRIKDAIAAKQLEIEKAEVNDVEKAEALVAILTSYISRHSA